MSGNSFVAKRVSLGRIIVVLFTFFDSICCSSSNQTQNFREKYLKESKATSTLSLFLLAAKKKTIIVSFWKDSSVLTGSRTAGAATLCKNIELHSKEDNA